MTEFGKIRESPKQQKPYPNGGGQKVRIYFPVTSWTLEILTSRSAPSKFPNMDAWLMTRILILRNGFQRQQIFWRIDICENPG
jgi:hypothetical protein